MILVNTDYIEGRKFEMIGLVKGSMIHVNTDQTEHTARRFSAWLPPIQCTLSGHQCMLIIQV